MAEFITRRAAASGLATLGAVVLRPRGGIADSAGVEAAARSEGSVTWYMAQADAETSEALGRAFSKEHPGISVSVIRTTGQVAFQRLLMDIKNHTPQCDVFSATDIAHMPILKERQELTPFTPDNAAGLMPAFKRVSDDGYYYVTNAGRYFLIYNNQKVTAEASPKAWTDLLLPQWKGLVATGHPAFSGCTGVWALSLKKLYGWEFFEKLAANNPRIGRSAADPITLLNAGECVVGVGAAGECLVGTGPLSTAMQNVDKGNPVGFIYPEDATVITVGPSAVLATAPHPNAARLYLEWLFSSDYAQACAEWHLEPVRADAPPIKGARPIGAFKSMALSTAEIAKGIPEVIEQWRDTFGN